MILRKWCAILEHSREDWMSGLNQQFTKLSSEKSFREFESHILRQEIFIIGWLMYIQMNKMRIIIENIFVQDESSGPTEVEVFGRVFATLIDEGHSLGKVFPVYAEFNKTYKIIGVFTSNNSGSISFFPDAAVDLFFDHITLAGTISGHHHLTGRKERCKRKLLKVDSEKLSNDTYHLLTIKIGDLSLLQNLPREILCPEIDATHLNKIKDAFILENDQSRGSLKLENESSKKSLIFQIILVPKEVDYKRVMPYLKHKDFGQEFNINDGEKIINNLMPPEFNINYNLCISSVFGTTSEKHPIFLLSCGKNGYYNNTGIEIEYKNKPNSHT